MPLRLYKRHTFCQVKDESGTFLVTFAISLLSLILVVGLAVDGSILYLSYQRLQTGLDLAAIAGGRMLINTDVDVNDVIAKTENIARENLRLMGIDPAYVSDLHALPAGDRLRIDVTGRLNMPTFIVKALPGLSQLAAVDTTSSVKNKQYITQLVIDVSGSIATDLTAIKADAKRFVDLALPGDKIGLISFSTDHANDANEADPNNFAPADESDGSSIASTLQQDARVESPIATVGDGVALKNAIDALQVYNTNGADPSGWTNIAAGIKAARLLLALEPPNSADISKYMVVFSDGMPDIKHSTGGGANFRWLTERFEQFSCPGLNPQPPPPSWWPPPRGAGTHTWTMQDWYSYRVNSEYYSNSHEMYERQLTFLRTISESDLARDADIRVFTLGYGNYDNGPPYGCNPFQIYCTRLDRTRASQATKPILFVRLANDQAAMTNPSALPPGYSANAVPTEPNYPAYNFDFPDCVASGASIANKLRGKYLHAPDEDTIRANFERIALSERSVFIQ